MTTRGAHRNRAELVYRLAKADPQLSFNEAWKLASRIDRLRAWLDANTENREHPWWNRRVQELIQLEEKMA